MTTQLLSVRAAMVATLACFLCASVSTAQIRETKLYIDNGSGGFTLLTAPGSPGTIVFPSGGGTVLTSLSGGMLYNAASAQVTATPGSNYLFNVQYAPSVADATVMGAVINSTTTSATNVSTTGLTVGAVSTTAGGTVTGLTSSAQGGGAGAGNATLGVVGLANSSTFTLPISGQSGYQDASTEISGGGAAVVGYNITDDDNQFAGYFYGNKTNKDAVANSGDATGVLTAIDDIRAAIPTTGNGQPAAGLFRLYDNVTATYGTPVAPTAIYAETYSASDNSKINGIVTHVSTTAAGDAGSQASGLFAYVTGDNPTVVANKRIIGVGGWADAASATSTYDMLGVVGGTNPYGNTLTAAPKAVGGYFIGQSAHSVNLGSVAQVGGSTYQAWEDVTFAGDNIAVVGMNYNTPSATNLAGYFGGNVDVTGDFSMGNHVIATSSGTAAVSTNAVTVTDNPVFIITGSATATIALTMPATPAATGDMIVVINQVTTYGAQNGSAAETVPAGGSRTFYYNGTAWQ